MAPILWPLQLQLIMFVHPDFPHRAGASGVTLHLETGHLAGLAK